MGSGEWGVGSGEWGVGKIIFYSPIFPIFPIFPISPTPYSLLPTPHLKF
ncbi:MAG: hypothetical protein DSM106950_29130 [Stigonema ocellatum SAG 48.90 = DSM 106950]|nr:hypothetical protein [Stigonema ocellatum SAG 48.90 = DSM 106950]